MSRLVLVAVIITGCASGKTYSNADANGQGADAKVYRDGQIEPQPDASHVNPPPDAPPDAFVYLDACVPQSTELLANPVFDLTPMGTGWQQTPIDPTYPPITDQGFAPQSAPYKVWMGGFEADLGLTVTDVVYQDIVVPANTTSLVITGYYVVGTQETTTTSVYDTGSLALVQTNGTPIEGVVSLTNLTNTGTTWTAINHTFGGNLSGQTVRLRVTSSNDDSFVTNFFFDTLSLKATHCP
jgi:hypothetical protein